MCVCIIKFLVYFIFNTVYANAQVLLPSMMYSLCELVSPKERKERKEPRGLSPWYVTHEVSQHSRRAYGNKFGFSNKKVVTE